MAYELGGRADKYGNRFEINWTIRKLLEVIDEKVESVTIEALGDDEKGADLWITYKDGRRESQQCKGRNGSLEYWDYGSINSKNIWKTWQSQLDRDKNIIVSLVTPLNCTMLEDIGNRARTNGQDSRLFYDVQIQKSGTDTKRFFNNVCHVFGLDVTKEEDLERALEYFSRMYMRQVTDGEMREENLSKISYLFLGDSEAIYRIFIDYILNEDIYGKSIDASELGYYLEKHNVEYRNLVNDSRVWPTIIRLNEEYQQVFKPFSCGYIDREETERCLNYLKDGMSVVLHGNAGIGKSGCTENLINRLRNENITFLAIKLDRNVPEGNSELWAKQLGLPASISYCINAITPNQRAVILLDQLDALRWTQAHSSDALTICTQIINEIKQFNKERVYPISLIFVCRTYDLNNDSFISSLFMNEESWKKVSIGLLNDSELKKVLGMTYDRISLRTRNLLRTPSNLYIWEKLDNGKSYDNFSATHQLIREWWNQLTYACHFKNLNSDVLEKYRNNLVKFCYENSKLNMPKFLLNLPGDYEDYLVSSGFIVVENNLVAFVHQSILDCFFAEEMIREYLSGKNIMNIIGEKSLQTPSKRYQFVIFMQQLAELSEQDFINIGTELLNNENVRYSFKYIFIEVLSQIPSSQNVRNCICSLLNDDVWKECILNTVIRGSNEYVHLLRENGQLSAIAQTNGGMATVIELFHSIKAFINEDDVRFIKENITEDNSKEWSWIISGDIDEDTESLFKLRLELYDTYPGLLNHYLDLNKLMEKCETRAISILARMLKEKIRKNERSLYRDADELMCSEKDLFVNNYRFVLDTLIPLFPDVSEKIRWSDWSLKHSFRNSLERTCVILVKLASEAFAKKDPEGFIDFYKFAYEKGNSLYNEIILDALFYIDESYSDYVLDYISREAFINALEDSSNNGNELLLAKKCVTKFSSQCSEDAFQLFEDRVIRFNYSRSKDYLNRRIEWNRERKKLGESSVYFSFWGDLQYEIIPAICEEKRSKKLNDLWKVLDRRYDDFISIFDYEEDGRACSVISPVSGKELSLQNWQRIITNKKIVESRKTKWKHKDGICIESSLEEFARAYSSFVSDNPFASANLMLTIEREEVHNSFVNAFFSGLAVSNKIEDVNEELLADLIRKYGYDYESSRASNIADVIEKISVSQQLEYFVSVLLDIIENHTNPKEGEQVVISSDDKEGNKVSSIESNAINCVRGRAIKALSSLVWEYESVYENNKAAIVKVTEDQNVFISYAALFLLWPIINYDPIWAKKVIFDMFKRDYRLAGFMDSRSFFCICRKDYTEEIIDVISKMFQSDDERLIRIAGYSMAELFMIEDLFSGIYTLYVNADKNHRKPILEMTITYFEIEKYRDKAKILLEKIILIEDDKDNEYLWGKLFRDKLVDASQDKELIDLILKSKIKKNVLSHFFEYVFEKNILKQYANSIFELSISILEKPDEVKYIWGVDTELLKMILGLYDETSNSINPDDVEISLKCLDLWDKMYEKNVGMARNLTEQLLCK